MKEKVNYVRHLLFHPIDGFYDLKHEGKGSLLLAAVSLLLWVCANVVEQEVTSFLFNEKRLLLVNLGKELMKILVITLLFCIGNWSVTTLMNGEGRFRDIVMVFGYAAVPLWLIRIPLALVSTVLSYSEQAYYTVFYALAFIWFFFLLFAGVITVHQYTVAKMVATILLTLVAMAVLVFIYLLFFHLVSEVITVVVSIYQELSLRM